ncbi:MAG: serine dehydratase subunit alpha family protein [Desulfobulbaceae bacterium]|nr:serine dehydratase subunit alpha family protein [Desulfobulbaceae bacterium]MCK5403718.1 serine dehydratase subunit alpha family protein [Desulfobulbaceae bacterium]
MSYTVTDILRLEVAPSLGCTEPAAIALGAAAAASLIGNSKITKIEVWVDPNIYKNSLAVSIPGADGLCGIDLASALGALGGDPELGLEVLEPVDNDSLTKAKDLLKTGQVKVNLLADHQGLFIRTVVRAKNKTAESVVQNSHDSIISLSLNGKKITDNPLLTQQTDTTGKSRLQDLESWLKDLSLAQLYELVYDLTDDDINFLEEGVQYNLTLAEYGLKHGSGLGIGKMLDRLVRQRLLRKDMVLAAKILTASASDARMAGVKMPAMSSAGSGNHGLTAILPIWAVKDYLDCEKRCVLEAIGLSHIITAFVKAYTGRLSALCGCSIAAGAGAAAGISHMLGGNLNHISGAIKNLTEDLAGVICDGAKAGCSLKLSTAAGSAVQAALFALQGTQVHHTNGIIEALPEHTIKNIGAISTQGMIETERTILRIMMDKQLDAE